MTDDEHTELAVRTIVVTTRAAVKVHGADDDPMTRRSVERGLQLLARLAADLPSDGTDALTERRRRLYESARQELLAMAHGTPMQPR